MKGASKCLNALAHKLGIEQYGKHVKTELSNKMRNSVFIIVNKDLIRFNKSWVINNQNSEQFKSVVNYAVTELNGFETYKAYDVSTLQTNLYNL